MLAHISGAALWVQVILEDLATSYGKILYKYIVLMFVGILIMIIILHFLTLSHLVVGLILVLSNMLEMLPFVVSVYTSK